MADWTQVIGTFAAVALGGAVGAVSGWLAAREQSKALLKQAQFQHHSAMALHQEEVQQRAQDKQRQLIQEVRKGPLLAFREELATFAQKVEQAVIARDEISLGIDSGEWANRSLDAWVEYDASGAFARAKFRLTDPEILKRAEEIQTSYRRLYWAVMEGARTEEDMETLPQLRIKVMELQELINQRLQAS